MVDTITPADPAPVAEPKPGGVRGFLASTAGKLVVGGLLVLLVFAAIGVALVMFVFSAVDEFEVIVTTPPPASPGTAFEPIEPAPLPLDQVFTFRDIFDPLIKPLPPEETTQSPDATGTPAPPPVSQDTLYLQDIVTEDGEPVAVLLWNGETYRLTVGERVADTPWQVLEIREGSVVMLFGDTTVTLTIGQGITK